MCITHFYRTLAVDVHVHKPHIVGINEERGLSSRILVQAAKVPEGLMR